MSFVFHTQRHFKTPTSDGKVETVPFLDASNEILHIIDYLGPSFLKSAFERTRADIAGNITIIRNKYDLDPVKHHTLNDILDAERGTDCSDATISLLWLKRTLEFLYHISLLVIEEDGPEGPKHINMSSITLEAYDLSLKRFHNYLLQGLFYLIAHILPSKKDFIIMLAGGDESKRNEVSSEFKEFTSALKPSLGIINKIYIDMGRNEEY